MSGCKHTVFYTSPIDLWELYASGTKRHYPDWNVAPRDEGVDEWKSTLIHGSDSKGLVISSVHLCDR